MAASINDKLTASENGGAPEPTTVSSARSIDGTTLSCVALTNWPTATAVHLITYQKKADGSINRDTLCLWKGIVSGTSIGTLTLKAGTDAGNAVGDFVEMAPTSAMWQDLYEWGTAEHNQDGTHAQSFLDKIYPVGSIYTNASVSTNPGTLLGFGTWTSFGTGKVLVGIDSGDTDFDTAGDTGGEKTHTLTVSEMPSHNHSFTSGAGNIVANQSTASGAVTNVNTASGGLGTTGLNSTGGGGSHNNLQPYIVVYMWKRTA